MSDQPRLYMAPTTELVLLCADHVPQQPNLEGPADGWSLLFNSGRLLLEARGVAVECAQCAQEAKP